MHHQKKVKYNLFPFIITFDKHFSRHLSNLSRLWVCTWLQALSQSWQHELNPLPELIHKLHSHWKDFSYPSLRDPITSPPTPSPSRHWNNFASNATAPSGFLLSSWNKRTWHRGGTGCYRGIAVGNTAVTAEGAITRQDSIPPNRARRWLLPRRARCQLPEPLSQELG